MGAIMVLHHIIIFSDNNIVHEEAKNKANDKNKAEKRSEAVQETQIEAETLHMSLLRQLKSPDVSIIYR